MIPNGAVEAALRAWGVSGQVPRNIITVILEAGAPHMLAEAWEDGRSAGRWENSESNYDSDVEPNPYRADQ